MSDFQSELEEGIKTEFLKAKCKEDRTQIHEPFSVYVVTDDKAGGALINIEKKTERAESIYKFITKHCPSQSIREYIVPRRAIGDIAYSIHEEYDIIEHSGDENGIMNVINAMPENAQIMVLPKSQNIYDLFNNLMSQASPTKDGYQSIQNRAIKLVGIEKYVG